MKARYTVYVETVNTVDGTPPHLAVYFYDQGEYVITDSFASLPEAMKAILEWCNQ